MEALSCWPQWSLLYIVGFNYENALPEWDYLRDYFRLLEHVTGSSIVTRERRPAGGQQRCVLELKIGDVRKQILTVSAHAKGGMALSAKGEAPDMVLLVEMESLPYDVYLAARGRVAEKRGRIIISGTFPDDVGWAAELWQRWKGDNEEAGQSFSLATWSNKRVFPDGLDDPEIKAIKATVTNAEFMRRYGAIPQKPATLVFPEFSFEKHVREFAEYDPGLPVEFWIDPGYGESSYAVLAVQVAGKTVFVFDEIHVQGHTGEEVIALAKKKWEWFDRVRGGVGDFAVRQHHAAKSQLEVWQGKAGIYLRNQQIPLEAGRLRLQSFLLPDPLTKLPRIFFNPRCKKTAAEFGRYVWRRTPEERLGNEQPIDRYCDCFDEATEILTRGGWVAFPDLEEDHLVATLRDGELVYKHPTERVEYDYEGPLYVAEGNGVNFAVTPNHRLFVANQYSVHGALGWRKGPKAEPEFSFIHPPDLPRTSWLLAVAPDWIGQPLPPISFTHKRQGRVVIAPDDWARFVGLWLADGCRDAGAYRVIVDQKVATEAVRSVIYALGLHVTEQDTGQGITRFAIACHDLFKYFEPLGHSDSKYVPREFLDAPRSVLEALLEGYWLGDGSKGDRRPSWQASSASERLADDMQEVAFKLGKLSTRNDYEYDYHKCGLHHLSVWGPSQLGSLGLVGLHSRHIRTEPYAGKVYCVRVPSGIIAVRRNGRIMWSGNSIKALTYGLIDRFGYVEWPRVEVSDITPRETLWNRAFEMGG